MRVDMHECMCILVVNIVFLSKRVDVLFPRGLLYSGNNNIHKHKVYVIHLYFVYCIPSGENSETFTRV